MLFRAVTQRKQAGIEGWDALSCGAMHCGWDCCVSVSDGVVGGGTGHVRLETGKRVDGWTGGTCVFSGVWCRAWDGM